MMTLRSGYFCLVLILISLSFSSPFLHTSLRNGYCHSYYYRSKSSLLSLRNNARRNVPEPEKPNGWESFKRVVYNSVDGANDLITKIKGDDTDTSNKVSDGYSSFEQSLRSSPGNKILTEYQSRITSLGVDQEVASSNNNSSNKSEKSSFDRIKENFYFAADALKKKEEDTTTTPGSLLQKNMMPYKSSLAQELNNEDLLSSNPIKRFQAEQEIREREAQKRAELRNEKIRARKDDLYKIVDSFQAAVDSIPERIEQTEKSVKDVTVFVMSVPTRVEKVVEDVKTIPDRVEETKKKTKERIDETTSQVKKAVDDVIDTPNKVKKMADDTKQSLIQTKENIEEGITNVKVFLRLEKPKPKPPKLPPPKPKTAQDIALDIAGNVAKGAGQVAWWGAKGAANLAWTGAVTAFEKGKEAIQDPKTAAPIKPSDDVKQTQEPIAETKEQKLKVPDNEDVQTNVSANIPAQIPDTDDVEQEVADALKAAEASLKKASKDDDKKS